MTEALVEKKKRGSGLTEQLCGVCVARGFLIVGESLIDDLPHSGIQTLQFLIL